MEVIRAFHIWNDPILVTHVELEVIDVDKRQA